MGVKVETAEVKCVRLEKEIERLSNRVSELEGVNQSLYDENEKLQHQLARFKAAQNVKPAK